MDFAEGGRDFNEIMTHEDKKGGNRRSESSFALFRSFIRDMKMEEILFRGRRWTWANNRQEEGFIEERLDMGFGSAEWLLEFGNSEVQHLITQASDHSMLLVDTDPQQQKKET